MDNKWCRCKYPMNLKNYKHKNNVLNELHMLRGTRVGSIWEVFEVDEYNYKLENILYASVEIPKSIFDKYFEWYEIPGTNKEARNET